LEPCTTILSIAALSASISNVCFFAGISFVFVYLIIVHSECFCKLWGHFENWHRSGWHLVHRSLSWQN